MRLTTLPALVASLAALVAAAPVPLDSSRVQPGAITLQSSPESFAITWPGDGGKQWTAVFSLDPAKPLVSSIGTGGRNIIERAQPQYWITTGKRRGGFDQFFDLPPSHPEGIRRFTGSLQIKSARAETIGDRLEITFDGLSLGIFQGSVRYIFYPGSQLIQQQAVLVTSEPDVAYFYDAGLKMAMDADRRAGGNMETAISYFDTRGQLQTAPSSGPERIPLAVRYRAISAATGAGSVAIFPPPHQFFFARDYTTNMGYVWHSAWRGNVALGIRQLPDDYTPYYPWMGAPPGTTQEMSLFLLVDDGQPAAVLEKVTRYTHRDRLPKLDGYKTVAPHWHLAYTVQAMEKGFDWLPPFKPAMKEVGIDSAILMDFHGDGHPFDTTEIRLKELQAYFKACQSQSDKDFLLIPAEEMNQYLGGHWGILFPKPVYWFMKRAP
ncbi:MAG TPA: hypothetical protein VMZ52_07600, partial [Bryobacteraceae bacterium]|nr:hypothetical protein [Bryobacteraceae bacterium]